MKKHIHKIAAVEEGSIAWELGIEPGDRLLSIDGHEIEDIFDYQCRKQTDWHIFHPLIKPLRNLP